MGEEALEYGMEKRKGGTPYFLTSFAALNLTVG